MKINVGQFGTFQTYQGPQVKATIADDHTLTVENWINPDEHCIGTTVYPPGSWAFCAKVTDLPGKKKSR